MKAFILKALKQVASLFTDKDFDADCVKVLGVGLVVLGLFGWWMGKSDFQWVIGFGAALAASGKFSTQG